MFQLVVFWSEYSVIFSAMLLNPENIREERVCWCSCAFCQAVCCCVKSSGVGKIVFGTGTKVIVETCKSAHLYLFILIEAHLLTVNLQAAVGAHLIFCISL